MLFVALLEASTLEQVPVARHVAYMDDLVVSFRYIGVHLQGIPEYPHLCQCIR